MLAPFRCHLCNTFLCITCCTQHVLVGTIISVQVASLSTINLCIRVGDETTTCIAAKGGNEGATLVASMETLSEHARTNFVYKMRIGKKEAGWLAIRDHVLLVIGP